MAYRVGFWKSVKLAFGYWRALRGQKPFITIINSSFNDCVSLPVTAPINCHIYGNTVTR